MVIVPRPNYFEQISKIVHVYVLGALLEGTHPGSYPPRSTPPGGYAPKGTPRAVPPGGTLQESTRPKEYHQEGAPLGGAPLGVYSLEGYTLGGTHWGTPLGGTPQGVSPWGYSPRGTPWVVTPGDHPRRVPPKSYLLPTTFLSTIILSKSNQHPINILSIVLLKPYQLPMNFLSTILSNILLESHQHPIQVTSKHKFTYTPYQNHNTILSKIIPPLIVSPLWASTAAASSSSDSNCETANLWPENH